MTVARSLKPRRWIATRKALWAALAMTIAVATGCTTSPVRRNVLVLIADDLGAEQPIATKPFLFKLAECGLTFENAWATPTCSPTRATLLVGQYPFRHGITDQLAPEDVGLDPAFVTLPEALHEDVRAALIGKWHLGVGPD